MEVFTDVRAENFRTGLPPFQRPTGTSTGSELCIAVSSQKGQILTAFYSVIVTLLFVDCWKLVSIVVMYLSHALDKTDTDPDTDTNLKKYCRILREIGLVGFWNAREPLEASLFLWGYLTRLGGVKGDKHIGRPALMMFMVAVAWVLGTYAASILVAAELIAGHVAPANPNKVYVPNFAGTASADIMRLQALRAPAALRSLGSAEAANDEHTIRKLVTFEFHLQSGDSPQYFTYKYTVNAHNMGLQKWYDLKQDVNGRCDIDNSWFSKYIPEEDLDVYRPWGLDNVTVTVVRDGERNSAPRATAMGFPYADDDFLTDQVAEHRYGIMVHSSHRASYRPGTDPWYKTESFTAHENSSDARIPDPPANRVIGGRPALRCTQKDVWSYNGKQFKNIFELANEKNINFPRAWWEQLQHDFGPPRVIDVINSAGPSSLVSSTTFVGNVFDAETATIENDMKRLFTATWVSSAHTFRNMLMVIGEQNIRNSARDGGGQPQAGVGQFVVSTPQVATLRLSVLITIPALLAFFKFALSILNLWARRNAWYNKIYYAEGAYLTARVQDKDLFKDLEGVDKVVQKCVKAMDKPDNPS